MDQNAPLPAAGWYTDPSDSSQQRWWDGDAWTDRRQQAAPPASMYAPPAYAPEPTYATPTAGYAATGYVPLQPASSFPSYTPDPLDLPLYGASFGASWSRFWRKYATFRGRASPSEFWWMALALGIVNVVLLVVNSSDTQSALAQVATAIGYLVVLGVFLPTLAVTVRRLHDANFSGWFVLLQLVPVAAIALFIMTLIRPKPEGARFDKPRAQPHRPV